MLAISLRFRLALAIVSFFAACLPHSRVLGQLPDARRIVFLGDSITYDGRYIVSLESAALAQYPERSIEFLNVGLPSETVSGLSEPGHAGGAFPRPDLHERLQRVLDQTQPDLVVACYGMNDGIYYPVSEERFAKFRDGIERLHKQVEQRGAKIIHLTPAYFDALPIRDRLLPAGLKEYPQPFEGYDEVLETYTRWLLSQRERGWVVYDVHGAMKEAVAIQRRSNANFTFASDGVHPNAEGQAVIARPLAEAWGLKLDSAGRPVHPKSEAIVDNVSKKQNLLKHAWLTATRHTRPGIPEGLPLDKARAEAAELDAQARKAVSSKP